MTNRRLACMVKDQDPLVMSESDTVGKACAAMYQRRAGSILVVDGHEHLSGIFTGRDAVRILANGADASTMPLVLAMTRNPTTIHPAQRAIDALRIMSDGGFRHLPVIENGRIRGVVSRGDFKGDELDRIDDDEQLAECIW
jgi:CBS domain-containing protein